MRYFLSAVTTLFFVTALFSQHWDDTDVYDIRGDRRLSPKEARGVKTSPDALQDLLWSAPHENDVAAEDSPTRLFLPVPNGRTAIFHITGYDVAAGNRFPQIRTWYGVNENDAEQTVFLDWTERGLHASVRGGSTPAFYIDPVVDGELSNYQSYYRSRMSEPEGNFKCGAKVDELLERTLASEDKSAAVCELLQYRIAITATPEYSAYHGAFSAADAGLVQSAVVTVVNRLNQIFTRDLSLRLQLVANNEELYLYDPATNPFSSNSVRPLSNQNIGFQESRIGVSNYDLGHVFTQGNNNGVAFLRSGCDNGLKSGGATSLAEPLGDPFSVDYVAHEIGHQLGANHTQNNSCNYSPFAGMEPGSGSSIMGYAGICFPNIQSNSDDYFHGRSLEEIATFLENPFTGGRCPTVVNNSLSTPTINPLTDHNIPNGTPFKLAAEATGTNNLSYSWEQFDHEQSIMPPRDTSTQGPLFRSFPPTADSARFFPNFAAVVAGTDPEWEELPSVERDMDFRLSVRHFNAAYGCSAAQNMTLTVSGEHGPFTVNDPISASHWSRGQTAQVQWNVAGTDIDSFASPTVDILLSLDNGLTFDTVAMGEVNDGLAEFTLPDEVADSARVLVRSSDNVFYNISNPGLKIVDSTGTPAISIITLNATSIGDCFSTRDEASFDFLTLSSGGASAPLTLSANDFPEGVTARFVPAVPRPGGRFTAILSGLSGLSQGSFTGTITAESAEGSVTEEILITKFGDTPIEGPAILGPTALINDIRPTLTAEFTGADLYQIQLSSSIDFEELEVDRTSTKPFYTMDRYLAPGSRYYWRVRTIQGSGGCGISMWSVTSFITGACPMFSSEALTPVTLSDGPPVQTAEITVDVTADGALLDVDLVLLDLEHSYLNDLEVDLECPAGTIVPIFRRSCGGNDDILMTYDDEAINPTIFCPPVDPTAFVKTPSTPLNTFDGEDAAGTWTIRVRDRANQDGGQLNGFSLKTCVTRASLPVTFLDFTATGRKTDILLNWATENESNNAGFYVERTPTAAPGNWIDLGFVAAEDAYTFTDETALPDTDYYFRLRQTDLDGHVNYSELRSARVDGNAVNSLRLFPNPTNGNVAYRWTVPADERTDRDFTLTDARGRVLREGRFFASGGSLSLTDLPGGVYFVRIAGMEALRVVRL